MALWCSKANVSSHKSLTSNGIKTHTKLNFGDYWYSSNFSTFFAFIFDSSFFNISFLTCNFFNIYFFHISFFLYSFFYISIFFTLQFFKISISLLFNFLHFNFYISIFLYNSLGIFLDFHIPIGIFQVVYNSVSVVFFFVGIV